MCSGDDSPETWRVKDFKDDPAEHLNLKASISLTSEGTGAEGAGF